MATIYDFGEERERRPRPSKPHPHSLAGLQNWPFPHAKLYSFQTGVAKRLSKKCYDEADALMAMGDPGSAAVKLEVARVVDEFDLGIDTGMDAAVWNACMGLGGPADWMLEWPDAWEGCRQRLMELKENSAMP